MKFGFFLLLASAYLITLSTSHAKTGGTSGGGGDKVEVLFISAQKKAMASVNKLNLKNIDELNVPTFYKNWLKENNRLVSFQYYTTAMEIVFQDEPCMDEGRPRGTTFNNSDRNHPIMCVSYSLNQNTTEDQAQALVFHEAGHFTGEMNHAFLSGLGVSLASHPLRLASGLAGYTSKTIQPDGSVYFSDVHFRISTESSEWLVIFNYYGYLDEARNNQVRKATANGYCLNLGYSQSRDYQIEEFKFRGKGVNLNRDGSIWYTRDTRILDHSNFYNLFKSITCVP